MRSLRSPLLLITTLALLASVSACQTAPANPVSAASRPETTALALYGSYTIVAEAAADIKENPATPPEVGAALKAADAVAYPIVKQLRPAAEEVQRIRAELSAGADADAKLAIAITSVNSWITRAAPLIKNFTDAVSKAKHP